MQAQRNWRKHAEFMNGLYAAGSIVLGGPLAGTSEILLIARAESEMEIEALLGEDPWSKTGLLTIRRIIPWTLRLGSID